MSSTFSESWHRVAQAKLGLLPSVSIVKQRFRGYDWYVLRDGFTQRYFRISPQTYLFVSRLNPQTTVEDAWQATLSDNPYDAPGQEEVMQVLSQLHQANLLFFNTKADSEMIFDRYQEFRRKEFHGKLLSFMSVRIPLWNPNPWLNRHRRLINAAVSWPVGLLIALVVALAAGVAISNPGELTSRSAGIFATDNLLWLYACMAAMKLLHEFGHAFTVKKFGGDVHAMGVMFLVFVPLPYVDATGSWMFRQRSARALVGAAGIIVELLLAALATFVWANTGSGLLNSLMFNIMVLGSVSSVLFNGNPLLRFDAYYVMADLLGIPNMYQKASQQWMYFADRYLLGTPRVESPALDKREWWWLTGYGVTSYIYRLLIFLSIWLIVTDNWFVLGVVFGITSLFILVVMPLFKWFKHLQSPALARNRRRAWLVSFAALAVPIYVVLMVPVRDAIRAPGVLEAVTHSQVVTEVSGVLREVRVKDGGFVHQGDVLVVLHNHELALDIEAVRQRLQEIIVTRDLALEGSPVEVEALNKTLRATQDKLDLLLMRQSLLVVRARHDGLWTGAQLHLRLGNWMGRGAPLGEISENSHMRFSAVVSQEQADALFRDSLQGAEIRLNGQESHVIAVERLVLLPYQRRTLQTQALGWSGGGSVPVTPDDPKGLTTMDPYYEVLATLQSPPGDVWSMNGLTGWLRVPLQAKPLAERWYKGWRQLVQKRYQM